MRRNKITRSLLLAFGVGVLTSVIFLPQARGELVFEDGQATQQVIQTPQQVVTAPQQVVTTNPQQPVQTIGVVQPQTKVDTSELREALREVLLSSQKAQLATTTQEATNTMATDAAAVDNGGVEHLSRSELIRRERIRTELNNEDILQQRIEELRLRDEKRLTDALLQEAQIAREKDAQAKQEEVVKDQVVVQQAAPQQIEVVGSAVKEQESVAVAQASSEDEGLVGSIQIQPKGGFTTFTGEMPFRVESEFTVGLGIGMDITDSVALEAGYAYSEYGVKYGSSYTATNYYNPYSLGYGSNQQTTNTHSMKQNLFDAGLKFYLLNTSSRIRPFIGGGGAYTKTYINYTSSILNYYEQLGMSYMTQDVVSDAFLGYVTAGMDVQLSKAISIGATVRYYTVLTAKESMPNNTITPNNGYYGYNNYNSYMVTDKQALGNSLGRSAFYSILAGISFKF